MKNLIIAPHIDDEVLGCYSLLNEDTLVCYIGVEDRSYVSAEERVKELEDAASIKKFKWVLFNNVVNNYKSEELITSIEELINREKPENVFIPHYSYNQDHRAVYDASMVALRHHDINWFVDKVFVYEQPHTILWPYKNFEPNFYITINIKDKIKTYNLYKSQVRGHRSSEIIEIMAKLRGKQANVEYAEAFSCIRYVVKSKDN
jgi:LmbE family N-acetylglucosaminyl deacetylase